MNSRMNYLDSRTLRKILSYIDFDTFLRCRIIPEINGYLTVNREKWEEIENEMRIHHICNAPKLFEFTCESGSVTLAKYCRKISRDELDWNYGLHRACKGGHLDLARLMIDKGANEWNWCLLGACEGGHVDLVQLMIDKGATACYFCGKSMQSHLN
jgi:hypothetical protein